MNLVYSIIFVVTAILVVIYDYKYKQIPVLIVLLNYLSLMLIIQAWIPMCIGLFAICLLYKLDKPIDIIYIVGLCVAYITTVNQISLLYAIVPIVIQTIISRDKQISLMISIEIGSLLMLCMSGRLI